MPGFGHTLAAARPDDGGLLVFALGQSSYALRGAGTLVLIDPWLSTALEESEGVTRSVPPALRPDEVEAVDLVCVTHEHADHLDPVTLATIARRVPEAVFVAPAPDVERVEEAGVPRDRIRPALADVPLEAAGVRVTPVASAHELRSDAFGGYDFWRDDRGDHRALGYVVELDGHAVYHGGDTIWWPGLEDAVRALAPELAILPINGRDAMREAQGLWGNLHAERGRGARCRGRRARRRAVPLRRRRGEPRRSRRVRPRARRARRWDRRARAASGRPARPVAARGTAARSRPRGGRAPSARPCPRDGGARRARPRDGGARRARPRDGGARRARPRDGGARRARLWHARGVAMGLHHVREGAGPPLVLLAGIGMSGAAWRPVIPRLAAEREVWAVDLPGFGASDTLPAGRPVGLQALSDAAERFCAQAGPDRPHVAGNSLGGAVALELGRRGAVASVTAISPAGFAGRAGQQFAGRSLQLTHWAGGRLRPLAPRLVSRPRLRRILYAQMFAHPERLTPGDAYAHLVTMLEGGAFHDVLTELDGHRFEGEIDVPVTIAWGTRDGLLLPTEALRARRLLPNARHVWLRGCGHVPMSDDPEQVARVLLEGSAARAGQNAVARASG